MYAASRIASSEVDAAITGGFEEVNNIIYGVLDRLGALAPKGCLASPFDRSRCGLVMGEGSAMLYLESTRGERAGVTPYGYLTGFAAGRDRTATLSDWGTGQEAVATVMNAAIEDAGLERSQIDAVWASANGSLRGDLVEARALGHLFSGGIPPVVAVKSAIGEYAGAGAIHLASAFIAVKNQFIPATLGFQESLEEVKVPVSTKFEERELRHILVNSISAGGGVISAVVSRRPV